MQVKAKEKKTCSKHLEPQHLEVYTCTWLRTLLEARPMRSLPLSVEAMAAILCASTARCAQYSLLEVHVTVKSSAAPKAVIFGAPFTHECA